MEMNRFDRSERNRPPEQSASARIPGASSQSRQSSLARLTPACVAAMGLVVAAPVAASGYVISFPPTLTEGFAFDFEGVAPGPLLPGTDIAPGVRFVEAPSPFYVYEADVVVTEEGEHVVQYASDGNGNFSRAISLEFDFGVLGFEPRAITMEVRRVGPVDRNGDPIDAPGNSGIELFDAGGVSLISSSLADPLTPEWEAVQFAGVPSSASFLTVLIAQSNSASPELFQFRSFLVAPIEPSPGPDLNGDGVVNGADLGTLLGSWGYCPGCPADIDGNGTVNGADLGLLIGAWSAGT